MKTRLLSLFIVCGLVVGFSGCGRQELLRLRGRIETVELRGDTLSSLRLTEGPDTMLFSLGDCRLSGGMPLGGDSAEVYYIRGRGDSLRALVLTVLPRRPRLVTPAEMAGDSLLTAPAPAKTEE